jgi:hypothetical protein
MIQACVISNVARYIARSDNADRNPSYSADFYDTLSSDR